MTGKRPSSLPLAIVRYGIGGVMILAGVVMLVVSPGGLGVDGFAMAAGGGLSVLLINFLYRLGVSGDVEREREEEARRYLDEHGEWPEDEPRRSGRTWRIAAGAAMPEDDPSSEGARTPGRAHAP